MINIKIVTMGQMGVGKSSLLIRFADDKFNAAVRPTYGIDFKTKEMTINGTKVKLTIWDTAGQERFRSALSPSYYRGGQGAILVFDVTSRDSFQKIEDWLNDMETYTTNHAMIKMLVGNKCDMEALR